MKALVSLAVAAAAAFTATAPASAQPAGTRTATVEYADLNLASANGADQLDSRIRRAAKQVCGAPESPVITEFRRVQSCRRTAYENAKPQVAMALNQAGKPAIVTASR